MKAATSVIVLAAWISSWVPIRPDGWAAAVAAVFAAVLMVALFAEKPLSQRGWPAKTLSVLSLLLLVGGVFLAAAMSAVGTSVDDAIALFYVIGFAAYCKMLAWILTPAHGLTSNIGLGVAALFVIAAWSWVSAFSMYLHRGAMDDATLSCILVPKSVPYATQLVSIWQKRLPEVASRQTGPTGTPF